MKAWEVSEADVQASLIGEESLGICLQCGAIQSGVEPDAENYRCEECGAFAVAGLEQALLMGRITIKEE